MTITIDNGLSEAQVNALRALTHISLGSLVHTIGSTKAFTLLDYMGNLEKQRTEARADLVASEQRVKYLERRLEDFEDRAAIERRLPL